MIINLVLDAAAAAAPAAIKNAWNIAANMYASMFTDNITVNLKVDYAASAGSGAFAGPDNGQFESYSSVYNYLTSHASPGDSTFAALPNASSIGGQSQVLVWNAQLKLMGLVSPNDTTTDDGSATFGTGISASLMVGVALHEFGHALGRVPWGPQPDIMDFNRFTSQGNFLFQSGNTAPPAYFSLNGGATKWFDWGQTSDPSDYLNPPGSPLSPNDPYNEFYNSNTLQYLTPADLEEMDALGFHLKEDAPAANAYDFNGANSGDILLQSASGQIEYANMAGGSFQGFVTVTNVPGWTVVGAGKISGNASSDVVIQNTSSSEIFYADLVNGAFNHWVDVSGAPGYNVVGVGDINDDHYADIVIQNHSDGTILYANMANGVFNGWKAISDTPGWSVAAVADINDDGYADVVIQKNSDGSILYANMAGGVFSGWVNVGDPVGWKVVGAGDIARDGYADIVIQDQSDGSIAYANMKNGVFNNWVGVGDPAGWNVIGVEDILGNGFDDIVIQNASTGQIDYADMTTGTFQHWVAIADPVGYHAFSQPGPAGTGNGPNSDGSSGVSSQVSSNSTGTLATSFDGGDGSGSNPDPLTGHVPMPAYNIALASGLAVSTGNSDALSGVMMFDPVASSGGAVPGVTMFDSPASSGGALMGVSMFDPVASNGGASSAANALDFSSQNEGNAASWLTEGAQNSWTPTNGAAQVPGASGLCSNPASIVTADNLQNLLHSGSSG
jgi:hypothetical protein